MRHRQRHVHRTIYDHLKTALTELDWIGGTAPWGQPSVVLIDYEPQAAGKTPADNTVSVSIGHQGPSDPYELGGGIHECRYTVFIDVYPTTEAVGVAIADDIKDAIDEYTIPLLDFTTASDGVATDALIEFTDVEVEPLQTNAVGLDKRSWRAVKAIAACYF